VAGVTVNTRLEVVGTAGIHQNRLAVLNPAYRLLAPGDLAG